MIKKHSSRVLVCPLGTILITTFFPRVCQLKRGEKRSTVRALTRSNGAATYRIGTCMSTTFSEKKSSSLFKTKHNDFMVIYFFLIVKKYLSVVTLI